MKSFIYRALLICMAVAAGCRDSHDHAHGDAHEHEEKTAQITVWNDHYELFVEHKVPVANRPTRFITHATALTSGEPRAEGLLKFTLRQGDLVFEHPQAAPDRPGIYIPAITFPKAGEWQMTVLIPMDGTNAAVELGTIRVYGDEREAAAADVPQPAEGISFLKEQQWKLSAKVEPLAARALVERVQVAAQTRPKPGLSASVAAPLDGQLALPQGKSFPLPGARVEAGELLAVLQPHFSDVAARLVEIEAEFGQAEADLKQLETAYERTKKLAAAEARTERELQEAEAALASARARYSAVSALRSTYSGKPGGAIGAMELRAPIAGIMTAAAAGIGELVSADQVLFTVLNAEILWIEARVPEAAIARVETAADAVCETLDGTQRMIPLKAEGGRLVFVGLEVDAATRTVPILYELNNAKAGLRAGQAVRLHLGTANAQNVVAIPDSALVEEGGLFVAFVQVAGETFQKRELRLGIRDGDWIQVLSGVKAGERVVTKGAYALRLASASGTVPAHGHEH